MFFEEDDLFFSATSDCDKLLNHIFDISYDIKKVINILKRLLSFYIKSNIGKIIFIFINSKIVDLSFDDYNDVYVFDVAVIDDYKNYNLISYDSIKELDYKLVMESIANLYPLNIDDKKIEKYMFFFFKYIIYSKSIFVYSEEEFVIYFLLNKCVNINQKILPIDFIVNNDIKSFLASL